MAKDVAGEPVRVHIARNTAATAAVMSSTRVKIKRVVASVDFGTRADVVAVSKKRRVFVVGMQAVTVASAVGATKKQVVSTVTTDGIVATRTAHAGQSPFRLDWPHAVLLSYARYATISPGIESCKASSCSRTVWRSDTPSQFAGPQVRPATTGFVRVPQTRPVRALRLTPCPAIRRRGCCVCGDVAPFRPTAGRT